MTPDTGALAGMLRPLLVGALAGLPLGAAWFAALHATVRLGLRARRPALVFVSSLVLRLGVLVVALWWLGRGAPARLVGVLLGMLVARAVAIRVVSHGAERPDAPASVEPTPAHGVPGDR